MTRGQIAQLEELQKCFCLPRRAKEWIDESLWWSSDPGARMGKYDKADLRRLWHLYRYQIRAMRKNRNES